MYIYFIYRESEHSGHLTDVDSMINIQKNARSSVFTLLVCSCHSSSRRRRRSLVFDNLNRPAHMHMVACNQAVLDPFVPEDQQRQEEEQLFFNLNRILKVNISTRDIPVDARQRIDVTLGLCEHE